MGFAKNTPDWKNVSPVDSLHAQSARRGLRDTDQQQFHSGSVHQQDSEVALSQVCRLFEQSQQQHQEMMNHVINMGNHREPYQPHSKLSELQKTRPQLLLTPIGRWKPMIGFVRLKGN